MARTINLNQDDSTAEILHFLSTKINRYWDILDEMREDVVGNQLLIPYYLDKLRTLQEVYNHLRYN